MERIGGLRKQHAGSGCGVWRAVALRRGSNGAPTPPRGARRLGPAPGPRRLRRPPGLPRPARTPASGGRTTRGSRRPCPGGATYVLCRGHCHCHCCVLLLLLLLPLPQQVWSRRAPSAPRAGERGGGCGVVGLTRRPTAPCLCLAFLGNRFSTGRGGVSTGRPAAGLAIQPWRSPLGLLGCGV